MIGEPALQSIQFPPLLKSHIGSTLRPANQLVYAPKVDDVAGSLGGGKVVEDVKHGEKSLMRRRQRLVPIAKNNQIFRPIEVERDLGRSRKKRELR